MVQKSLTFDLWSTLGPEYGSGGFNNMKTAIKHLNSMFLFFKPPQPPYFMSYYVCWEVEPTPIHSVFDHRQHSLAADVSATESPNSSGCQEKDCNLRGEEEV